MKLNKYRLGSPLRSASWNMQETAFAPQIMRQQHDLAQQALLDQEGKLQFEYFDQDDPYVSPVIDDLQNKISQAETRLVKEGYNPDIQNQLVQLRREYMRKAGPQGTLGRAQKVYQDAMTGWKDIESAYRKEGQPEDYINKVKNAYFANYKGMMSPEGQYQGFTPGRVTGYRDIGKDFLAYAKEAGIQEDDLGKFMSGQVALTPVQGPNGSSFLQLTERTPGTRLSDAKKLQDLANEFYTQYTDPTTDRGLFAQLAGKSPQEIARTLTNMQSLASTDKYGIRPTWNASMQQVRQPSGQQTATASPLDTFQQYPVQNIEQFTKDIDRKYDKLLESYNEKTGQFEVPINSRYQNFTYIAPGIVAKERAKEHPIKTINKEFSEIENQFSQIKDKVMSKDGFTMTTLSGEPRTFKGNNKDFLEAAKEIEKYYAATMGTELGLNNKDIESEIMRSVKELTDEPSFVNAEDPSETLSKAQAEERMAPTGQLQVRVNARGDFIVQLKNKKGDGYEDYIINSNSLPTQSKEYDRDIATMLDYIRNFNLDDKTIKSLNNGIFEFNVGGKPYRYMLQVDENNPINKTIQRLEETPQGIIKVPTTMAEIQALNTLNKYQSIQPLK